MYAAIDDFADDLGDDNDEEIESMIKESDQKLVRLQYCTRAQCIAMQATAVHFAYSLLHWHGINLDSARIFRVFYVGQECIVKTFFAFWGLLCFCSALPCSAFLCCALDFAWLSSRLVPLQALQVQDLHAPRTNIVQSVLVHMYGHIGGF